MLKLYWKSKEEEEILSCLIIEYFQIQFIEYEIH